MSKRAKKTAEPTEPLPSCAVCDARPADGTLYVNYSPFVEQRESARPRKYDDPPAMQRGWSLHLPICGPCVRASVSVGIKMELRNEKGTWAHMSSEVPT
jgi:hypothetical protein